MQKDLHDPFELITRGYQLCFGAQRDPDLGRHFLNRSGELGRDDAYVLLGKSLELDCQYDAAAIAYQKATDRGDIIANFRLSLLHKNSRLKNSDPNYYYDTIRRLSKLEHANSIARYTKERLKGRYGFRSFFVAFFLLIPNFFRIVRITNKYKDHPVSDI